MHIASQPLVHEGCFAMLATLVPPQGPSDVDAVAFGVSLPRSLSSFASIPYGQWFRSDLQSVPQHSVLDMGTFANSTVLLNGGAGGATSPLGPLVPLAVFRLSAYAVCGGGIRVGSGGGPACPSVGAWLCLHSGMSLCVLVPASPAAAVTLC